LFCLKADNCERFILLKAEVEKWGVLSSNASGLTDLEPHRSTSVKWQVTAMVTPWCEE